MLIFIEILSLHNVVLVFAILQINYIIFKRKKIIPTTFGTEKFSKAYRYTKVFYQRIKSTLA